MENNLNIFFAPVSSSALFHNFEKTVIKGVDASEINGHCSKDIFDNKKFLLLWGIRDAKKTTFDKTQKGDVVFFYKEGIIIGFSIVESIFVDKELSIKLWGVFENKQRAEKYYWSNIICFNSYTKCKIPFSFFRSLACYDEKFSVRGYLQFRKEATELLFKKYGSLENIVEQK
jgi:hypothetical protein